MSESQTAPSFKLHPCKGRGKVVAGVFAYNIGFAILLDSEARTLAYAVTSLGVLIHIYGLVQNFVVVRKHTREQRRITVNTLGGPQTIVWLGCAALLGIFNIMPVHAAETTPTEPAATEIKKTQPATQQIQDIDNDLKGYHKGKTLTDAQVKENLRIKNRVLREDFDMTELCRLALGAHWKSLDAAKRKEFVDLFTSLLLQNAILHSEKHTGKEKIDYLKEEPIPEYKGRVLVRTRIEVPEESVDFDVDYSMLYDAQKKRWRIYDLILDGESLMENYRLQFDTIIAKNSFSDLVRRMRTKLAEGKGDGSLKAAKP